jgi:hypothetical protein
VESRISSTVKSPPHEGLYGLTAYQASRRTAEIGGRIALGAQRRDVVWMVLKSSITLVVGGSAFIQIQEDCVCQSPALSGNGMN